MGSDPLIHSILAPTTRRPPPPHASALCRCAPPRSSTLQQPSENLINDKRDARAGKHPDDIRGQASIKPSYAFMCPGVCDCGWDGIVVGAREHRVILLMFVSVYMRRPGEGDRWEEVERWTPLPECVNGSLGKGMLRITPRSSTPQT